MTQRISTVTANFSRPDFAYSGIGLDVRDYGSTNASKLLLISTGTGPKLTVYKDGGLRITSNVSSDTPSIFSIDDKINVKRKRLIANNDFSSEINTHDTAFAEDYQHIRSNNGVVVLNLANASTFLVESTTNTITSLTFVKPDDTFIDKDRTYSCLVMFKNVSVNTSVWNSAGIVWLDCIPPVTNANTTFVNFFSSESLSQAGLNSIWFGTGNAGIYDGIGGSDGTGIDGDQDCLMVVIENMIYAIPMAQLTGDFTMTPVYSRELEDTFISPYADVYIEMPYWTDRRQHDYTQHRFKNANSGFVLASVKFEDNKIIQTTDGYYLTPHTTDLNRSFKTRDTYIHPINGSANNVYMGFGDYSFTANSLTFNGWGGDKAVNTPGYVWAITPYAIEANGTRHYGLLKSEYGNVLSSFKPGSYAGNLPFEGLTPVGDHRSAGVKTYNYTQNPITQGGRTYQWPIYNTTLSWFYFFGSLVIDGTTFYPVAKYNPTSNPSTALYASFPSGSYYREMLEDPGYNIGNGYYPFLTRTTELNYSYPLLKYRLGTQNNPGEDFYTVSEQVTVNNEMVPDQTPNPAPPGQDYGWTGFHTGSGGITFKDISYSHNENHPRRYTWARTYGDFAAPYRFGVTVVNPNLVRPTDTISYYGVEFVPDYNKSSYYGPDYAQEITSNLYGDTDVPVDTFNYRISYHISNGVKTIQAVVFDRKNTSSVMRWECTYLDGEGNRITVDITEKLADALRVFGPNEYDEYTDLSLLNMIGLMVMDVRLSRIVRFT